ncbi:MAG TPA: VOC family protein [Acidimicrobiales bacterium]|nr:VOC family protein [Acidimicrobiales bacterium]
MKLAKDCLDVGLYTDRYDEMRSFYCDDLELPYEELLKVGGGIHQHRLGLRGSVLKVNSSRETLEEAPTNFIGFDMNGPKDQELRDPDGTQVTVSPTVERIVVHWASSAPERLARMLSDGFDALETNDGRLRVGTTVIALHPGGAPVGPVRSRGFRYLTVQVWDVRAEHANLVQLGWQEWVAPRKLGETAYISFVLDPDGSPIEISQRASLTGPLPDE